LQGSLSELDDTNITSNNLINKNLLKYDANLNSWIPSNIIDGGII
jgi:hypothetical protein